MLAARARTDGDTSCSYGVGARCRRFLRRQLVGVRTQYERGEPVCLITVPVGMEEECPVVVGDGSGRTFSSVFA